jgi:hypothetical protein
MSYLFFCFSVFLLAIHFFRNTITKQEDRKNNPYNNPNNMHYWHCIRNLNRMSRKN